MKKIDFKRSSNRVFNICILSVILVGTLFSSCKKNEGQQAPVVNKVRLVDASKADSIFTQANPGTMIAIEGDYLNGATNIYFNDFEAYFNPVYNTKTAIIITIPAKAPTAAIDPNVINKIRIVTNHGETSYDFTLTQSPPVIYSISNENPNPGDSVIIYGANFYGVDKVIFPGNQEIAKISVDENGSAIRFLAPNDLERGPLKIEALFGSIATLYDINNLNGPGVVNNFDDINTYGWGSPVENNPAEFPGNKGNYVVMSGIGIADDAWYSADGRAMYFPSINYVTPDHLKDPASSWAIKFDIFVKEPWTAGAIKLTPNPDIAKPYYYVYQPWKIGTATVPFVTSGWQTVTIPLSEFKLSKDTQNKADGDAAKFVGDLVDATGKNQLRYFLVSTPDNIIGKYRAAFDNMRIVKITK